MNLRYSYRLEQDDEGFGSGLDSSCSPPPPPPLPPSNSEIKIKNYVSFQERDIEANALNWGGGGNGDIVNTWENTNEAAKWRPDNAKMGKFTTTVVGGSLNPQTDVTYRSTDDLGEEERGWGGGRRRSRENGFSKGPGSRSSKQNLGRGITMVTEFRIED